ncbi:MAG TPA: NHLP bacteriocin system secretion protein [Stellaceae bacterium]|jgi:HlyD family secretion protein|nr:NHLP bacteriocin system secretion protein [Stellaceae bacterium]
MPDQMTPAGFRAEALARLRSPDQLDVLFSLTSPIGWLSAVVAGIIIGALILWGFVGELPFQVYGMGMILHEGGKLYSVPAPIAGQIDQLLVKVGDQVEKDGKIAVLSLPDQIAQRDGAKRSLENLQKLYKEQSAISVKEIALRRQATDDQVGALKKKIVETNQHLVFLQDYYRIQTGQMKDGFVTRQQAEQTQTQIYSAQQAVRDGTNSMAQAQEQQIDFEDSQAKSLAQIESQIISAENNLHNLNVTIDTHQVVTSPVTGQIVEVATKYGNAVNTGDSLVTIKEAGEQLQVHAYLPVTTSKTAEVGMLALVSPTTVERSIYGSIRGHIVSVSDLPISKAAVKDVLANDTVVSQMLASGPVISALISLDQDKATTSGLAWTSSSGPPFQVSAGSLASIGVTVMRDRPIDLVVPIYETWIANNTH